MTCHIASHQINGSHVDKLRGKASVFKGGVEKKHLTSLVVAQSTHQKTVGGWGRGRGGRQVDPEFMGLAYAVAAALAVVAESVRVHRLRTSMHACNNSLHCQ